MVTCEYCGQRNHETATCCEFCGGRLAVVTYRREEQRFWHDTWEVETSGCPSGMMTLMQSGSAQVLTTGSWVTNQWPEWSPFAPIQFNRDNVEYHTTHSRHIPIPRRFLTWVMHFFSTLTATGN